jgi:teichuronic acid biosynthesis glycosyltransferase TuaH
MHVDWRWIKQRPHIFAEGLSQSHDVLVAYRAYLNRSQFPDNPSAVARVPLIPWIDRGHTIWRNSDAAINQARVAGLIQKFKPDLIWLCFPSLLAYLPESAREIPLVYDCMDDATGFYPNTEDREYIENQELKLVQRASLVFCSSQYLARQLEHKTGRMPTVLRNGLPERWLKQSMPEAREVAQECHVAYFGTIADWFDWQAVQMAMEQIPNLFIHLYGPSEGKIKSFPRLQYHGVVAHSELQKIASKFDGFIMPFQVTNLIEGVDPVKLYEYLSFGKEVIAVHYDEIERFSSFAHLYKDQSDFVFILKNLSENKLEKRNALGESKDFLMQNTWTNRVEEINQSLHKL